MLRSAGARLRRHPVLGAAALYAALSTLMFAQALQPGHTLGASDLLWSVAPWAADPPPSVRLPGANPELSDSVQVFQPFLDHTRDRLPDMPLWNPHLSGGRPFLANQQSAVLSPFSLPAYLLPFWWSFGLVAALKVFVAAFGTFLLARALGMRDGGALLAGLVYGLSLFMLAWITWPLTNVWPLIPWLWLASERLVRRPEPLAAAGLAVLVGVQYLGGHPESSFHALAATFAFFALRLAVRARAGDAPRLRPALVWFGAALVAGTALAAVTLLPLLELIRHSGDLAQREALPPAVVERKYLLALMLPDYWGRPTGTSLEGFLIERAFYVGALPLVLAGAALIVRPRLERMGLAALGALSLAMVVGAPLVAPAIRLLPGFHAAHNTRLTIVFVLCAALLAGWGLDDLGSRARERGRLVAAWAAALVAVPVATMAAREEIVPRLLGRGLDLAWGFATPPVPPLSRDGLVEIRMGTLIVWLTFVAGAIALAAARRRLRPGWLVALALALVASDLFRAGMGQTPALTLDEATQPATGAIHHLQARRPARFVGLNSPTGPGALQADVAMRWGLYDARGYDFPVERRYRALWRRAVARGMPPLVEPTQLALAGRRSLLALRLLSVADVLQDPRDPPLTLPGLRLAYAGRDGRVYAHEAALPRVSVVGGQRVVRGGEEAELDAVLDPRFDGRREVVTSRPLPGLRSGPAPAVGAARLTGYEPERVVVRARAWRVGALVLTDVFYPGWKAWVDGRRAPIRRVDYLLRAVALGPGEHTVEMRYEPASYRVGRAVSLLALAGLIALATLALRARRRRSPLP
jgi:hypothetical protein